MVMLLRQLPHTTATYFPAHGSSSCEDTLVMTVPAVSTERTGVRLSKFPGNIPTGAKHPLQEMCSNVDVPVLADTVRMGIRSEYELSFLHEPL